MRYNRVNDEGYYTSYCHVERRQTEHENGECLSCWNKAAAQRVKRAFYDALDKTAARQLDKLKENS